MRSIDEAAGLQGGYASRVGRTPGWGSPLYQIVDVDKLRVDYRLDMAAVPIPSKRHTLPVVLREHLACDEIQGH